MREIKFRAFVYKTERMCDVLGISWIRNIECDMKFEVIGNIYENPELLK